MRLIYKLITRLSLWINLKILFAMAGNNAHQKLYKVIEPIRYNSIKDIRLSDFQKIIEILEKENIQKYRCNENFI
ncbi:hypothetical protein [Tepidibacter mesophilus]|uniref:hypothetical protein n=1 Tax=Tepidibacter mesophilus TaxID=655607 RepID=UPI000C06D2C3|nr:hypothetical protein [Tepidibacter mesophilus]